MNPTSPTHTEPASTVHQLRDDGYFGPGTVTWHVGLMPAGALAGTAAAILQMLLPPVMDVIDQASSFYKNPTLRGQLTGEYYLTVQFGDTVLADNAGASLWKIHTMKHATDPLTQQTVHATDPDLLLWVHNTVVWCTLRAFDRYGPKLSPADQDRYIVEQHTTARLTQVDVSRVPNTYPELNSYVESMTPKLAFTPAAQRFRDLLAPQHVQLDLQAQTMHVLANAAIDLLMPVHQELYGFHFSDLYRQTVRTLTAAILTHAAGDVSNDERIQKARAYVAAHPFGNRQVLINQQRAAEQPDAPAG